MSEIAARLLLIACYGFSLMGAIYGLFGIVRTAATRLPIPQGKGEMFGGLFLADMTIGLYPSSDRRGKMRKVRQFVWIFAFFFALWLSVAILSYQLLVPNQHFWTVLAVHGGLFVVVATPFVVRARTHANRFKR